MSAEGSPFDFQDEDYEPAWWVHRHDNPEDRHSQNATLDWLFDHRLPRTGVAFLFGPSGIGKTFLAIDLARAVATEGEFFGVQSNVRAGAVILAAEDAHGVRHRLLAALGDVGAAVGVAHVENLQARKTQERVRDLLDEACKAFREKGLALELGLVVVDTLTDSGLLADENSNAMCAEAMRVLRSLATRFRCLVVVLHHPGKKGAGMRGGYALFGSADAVVEVRRMKRSDAAALEALKIRNGPKGNWGSFTLEPCVVKADADGRDATTLRVVNVLHGTSEAEVSTELAAAIVAEMGDRSIRENEQCEDSVHRLIAACLGLDWSPGTTAQTLPILKTLLDEGVLARGTAYIKRQQRPVIFVAKRPGQS